MRGNGAVDAPRISNTPRMGREWAMGAFLGRPAAACARNVHRPRGGTMRHSPPMHGKGAVDAPRISNTPSVGCNWAGAFLGRPAAACARNRAPAANAEVASAAYGWSGPQRHETLGGCAEASDSTRLSPPFTKFVGFKLRRV